MDERGLVARGADHGLLELHLDQASLRAQLDDVPLDLHRHAGDQLGPLKNGQDVVEGDAALELQGREPGGNLLEPGPVLVEGRQRLVGLGQDNRDLLEHVLPALDVERDHVAPLGDGDHERPGLLGDPLSGPVPGAGLERQDRGIRHQLDVRPADLGGVLREHDRAVHLGHLVEQRGRVVHVDLDPARVQEREVVVAPDDDQRTRPGVQDVIDALS